jgi:hypothetical protein
VQEPVAQTLGQEMRQQMRAYISRSWFEIYPFRERFGQVLRQAINDFCAPSFILLGTQDVTANAPRKDNKLPGLQKEPKGRTDETR